MKSGILPLIRVIQPNLGQKSLATSDALGAEWTDWRPIELEFVTPEGAEAVTVEIGFEPCKFKRCPIIATMWLDGFKLQKINEQGGGK